MAFVITQPCIGCKDLSCVVVCPVDCIHEAADQLFIDPSACIDCGACESECPVDAIFAEDEVPEIWTHFVSLNAGFYRQQEKSAAAPNNRA